jgi:acetylornithine deacetylase
MADRMSTPLYDTLRRLVALDTVSTRSNIGAAEFLAERFAAAGFKVAFQRLDISGVGQTNLVAWAGPAREDGLIISGHIDTVPFEGQPGWTRNPLGLEIDGDRVYGRGTSDMKGFLAQCVDAAARLDLPALERPLVFVMTAAEEIGCLGAEKIGPELARILGETPVPRLAWIGEPTSYQVCHAHKSIVLFEVAVNGRGGHSGVPTEGVNAIAVMGKVLDTVGRLQSERAAMPSAKFADVFPESPCDVINLGTIDGGIAANIIAEQCRLSICYRSLPDADPLEIYREIERRIAATDTRDWARGRYHANVAVGAPMVVPPLLSPRNTALERALFAATGASVSRGAPFGTDGGWFARSGITSLVCGPGDLEQAHRPDESIGREALERGTDVILRVVHRMCVQAPAPAP